MRLKPMAAGPKAHRAAAVKAAGTPNNSETIRKMSSAESAPSNAPGSLSAVSSGTCREAFERASEVAFHASAATTLTVSSAFISIGCSPFVGVKPRVRYSCTVRSLFNSSSLRPSAPRFAARKPKPPTTTTSRTAATNVRPIAWAVCPAKSSGRRRAVVTAAAEADKLSLNSSDDDGRRLTEATAKGAAVAPTGAPAKVARLT
jgi:hypothetical protein